MLCCAELGAPALRAHRRRVRRLHRQAQGQRLPVAAHHRARRPQRQAHRDPDPHPGHARACRARRGRALGLQGGGHQGLCGRGRHGRIRRQDRRAAPTAGVGARPGRPCAKEQWPVRGPHLRADPRGRRGRPAPGRHPGGLCLHRAHQPGPPLPRRQGRRRDGAAEHRAAERPDGGDRHRERGPALARLAQRRAGLPHQQPRQGQGARLVQRPGHARNRGPRPGGRGAPAAARGQDGREARRPGRAAGLQVGRRTVRSGGQGRVLAAQHRDRAAPGRAPAERRRLPAAQKAARQRIIQPQGRRAGGGHRLAHDPAGQVLQARAARRHTWLCHARQGRERAPRRLQQLPRNGRQERRARDRRGLGPAQGQGHGQARSLPRGRGRGSRRPPGPAARYLRSICAREDQRHRRADPVRQGHGVDDLHRGGGRFRALEQGAGDRGGGARGAVCPAPITAFKSCSQNSAQRFWLGAASQAVRVVRQDAATTPEEFLSRSMRRGRACTRPGAP